MESLKYGVSFFEDLDILENYAEYLKCPTIDVIVCNPSNCVNKPLVFNCFFSIKEGIILVEATDTTLRFTINDKYIKEGYQYHWTFNTELFTTTDANQPILNLTGSIAVVANAVASIVITVTDLNGCEAVKTCFYNKDRGMNCLPYSACGNNNFLVVTMTTTPCLTSSNLVVT